MYGTSKLWPAAIAQLRRRCGTSGPPSNANRERASFAVALGRTIVGMGTRRRAATKLDDHILERLGDRYDEVLERLESLAGWKTKRRIRPLAILGNLDGVDTGLRNLQRAVPLETVDYQTPFGRLRLPTLREMLRIKAFLILDRNATREVAPYCGRQLVFGRPV